MTLDGDSGWLSTFIHGRCTRLHISYSWSYHLRQSALLFSPSYADSKKVLEYSWIWTRLDIRKYSTTLPLFETYQNQERNLYDKFRHTNRLGRGWQALVWPCHVLHPYIAAAPQQTFRWPSHQEWQNGAKTTD